MQTVLNIEKVKMARCNPVAVGEHEAEDLENWLVQNGSTHQTVFERIFTKVILLKCLAG